MANPNYAKADLLSPGEDGFIKPAKQRADQAILKRYVDGEVGLDETYYELLEGELIPMPQRCGMYTHESHDEAQLKDKIRNELFP